MCPAVPTTIDRISAAPVLAALPLAPARARRAALVTLRRGAAAARTALSVAHALEDLDQAEVDLPLLEVHSHDLHAHFVAQPIDLARVLAAQQMAALDEPVVVVGHRRNVDHPFDKVLDELDEEPERRH